jgi:L-lactate dehydrogenase complex protein LldG
MNPTIQQFLGKYEILAGKVHVAANAQQLSEILSGIFRHENPERIALGKMPGSLTAAAESAAVSAGTKTLKPPYRTAELPAAIDAAEVGVSLANFAIAETGTLVEFATDDSVRLISTLPRVHVGLVASEQIVATLMEAAPRVRKAYDDNTHNCAVTFISGPSRSGDIEMKLTLGVHGPAVAHAVVLDWPINGE